MLPGNDEDAYNYYVGGTDDVHDDGDGLHYV